MAHGCPAMCLCYAVGSGEPLSKGSASVHLWPPSLETEATGRNAYLAGNIHGMTYACKVTSTQMTSVMAMLCLSAKRNRAPS